MKLLSEGEVMAVELAKSSGQYTVVCTQGQGGIAVAGFPELEEALLFVKTRVGTGSYAIIYPDGSWHKWEKE